jgi:hypothetical protein
MLQHYIKCNTPITTEIQENKHYDNIVVFISAIIRSSAANIARRMRCFLPIQ